MKWRTKHKKTMSCELGFEVTNTVYCSYLTVLSITKTHLKKKYKKEKSSVSNVKIASSTTNFLNLTKTFIVACSVRASSHGEISKLYKTWKSTFERSQGKTKVRRHSLERPKFKGTCGGQHQISKAVNRAVVCGTGTLQQQFFKVYITGH